MGHVGLIAHGGWPRAFNPLDGADGAGRNDGAFIARSTKDLKAKDVAGKPRLIGFKFLRLRDEPLKLLKAMDGPDAPRVTLPGGQILKTQ